MVAGGGAIDMETSRYKTHCGQITIAVRVLALTQQQPRSRHVNGCASQKQSDRSAVVVGSGASGMEISSCLPGPCSWAAAAEQA